MALALASTLALALALAFNPHSRYIPVRGQKQYCDMIRELSGANSKDQEVAGVVVLVLVVVVLVVLVLVLVLLVVLLLMMMNMVVLPPPASGAPPCGGSTRPGCRDQSVLYTALTAAPSVCFVPK